MEELTDDEIDDLVAKWQRGEIKEDELDAALEAGDTKLLEAGTGTNSDTPPDKGDNNTPAGMHCSFCGATEKEAKLCTAKEGKLVPIDTPGSHVECFTTHECNARKWKKNNPNGWQSGSTPYTIVSKCRHEATVAFTLEGIEFCGGSESKVSGEKFNQKEWLVVSLLGRSKRAEDLLWCSDPSWFAFLRPFTLSPQITIDWPDMSAPPLLPGFWMRLVALAKKSKFKHVLFYCYGGHGRTGTALSAVLVECDEWTAVDAVKFVRKNYCEEAVETTSQMDYLKSLATAVAESKQG